LGGLNPHKLITLGIYNAGQTQKFGADLQIFPMRRFNVDFKSELAALQVKIDDSTFLGKTGRFPDSHNTDPETESSQKR
jgi:hypothetical protein